MSSTSRPDQGRIPSIVSLIGVVLLAGGVAAAIITRSVMFAGSASRPMVVLPAQAYTGYGIGPATPLSNPYELGDTVVLIAFAVAAAGLLVLVVGVALRATRRRAH